MADAKFSRELLLAVFVGIFAIDLISATLIFDDVKATSIINVFCLVFFKHKNNSMDLNQIRSTVFDAASRDVLYKCGDTFNEASSRDDEYSAKDSNFTLALKSESEDNASLINAEKIESDDSIQRVSCAPSIPTIDDTSWNRMELNPRKRDAFQKRENQIDYTCGTSGRQFQLSESTVLPNVIPVIYFSLERTRERSLQRKFHVGKTTRPELFKPLGAGTVFTSASAPSISCFETEHPVSHTYPENKKTSALKRERGEIYREFSLDKNMKHKIEDEGNSTSLCKYFRIELKDSQISSLLIPSNKQINISICLINIDQYRTRWSQPSRRKSSKYPSYPYVDNRYDDFFKIQSTDMKKVLICHAVYKHMNKRKKRIRRNNKGSPPDVMYTFIEQAVQPGAHISLKCSASGDPPPRFDWFLDTQFLTTTPHSKYSVGQYMDHSGFVVSHLNITGVRVEDGGLYECKATNSKGHTSHSARLNVYGAPYIRSMSSVRGVTGSDITILCPYYGFPISYVKWDSSSVKIVSNPRYRQDGALLKISNLDPATNAGSYTCSVATPSGELARREIQLVVNSPPVLSPLSFPPNLKSGERAQLSCTVTSGDMPVYFSWLKDGLPILASLQIEERSVDFYSYLLFKSLSASHSGTYTCVSSNSGGKVNTSAELIIKVPPYWSYEPQDVSTLLGSSVFINCMSKGYPEPRTYWSKQHNRASEEYDPISPINGHILIFNNGSLLINSISSVDEGNYRCTAENGVGPVLFKNIILSVNEPARFEVASQNITTRRNDPVTLVCDVLGDNPISNIWTHNTNPIDTTNFRFSLSELKKENGLRSQLSIERTDRQDSGLYRCQASNSYGRSEHFIHLAVQERPDPPSQLEVIEVASRSVRLAWRRPFDGNSPVLGYLVQYQPINSNDNDVWDNANIVNFTIATNGPHSLVSDALEKGVVSGLLPDTTYSMRMLAVNQIESSSFTETVVAKTHEEAPTEPPQNVQVQSGEAGELVVNWQAPSRNSWNGPLLGYTISWAETTDIDDTSSSALLPHKFATVKGAGSNKFTITGLRQFTRYKVTVRAFNRASAGPLSVPVMAITKEGVPTASPQSIRCAALSSQSLKLEWTPPPRAHHGGTLLGYKILYKPMADIYSADILPTSEIKRVSSSETYLHALLKYTNYSIQVLAYTSAGDGILSPAIFCTTEEDVPGPPADVKAISSTTESIVVSWLPPKKPNGRIVFYTIYYREAGRGGQPQTQVVNSLELKSFTNVGLGGAMEIRKLTENRRYEFWLTANTRAGEGEATTLVTQVTTMRVGARIASFGIPVRGGAGRSIVLGCMVVGNPTPRARWLHSQKPITHSQLYKVTAEGNLLIHNMEKAVGGNYTCSAKNIFGSDEIVYSVVCIMPPGAPMLEILYTTSNSVQVQWRPMSDGGSTIIGYTLVYKRIEESMQSIEVPSEVNTYNVIGLKCGSQYLFQISAYNRVGKGEFSSSVHVNTKGEAPKLPDDWEELVWSNSSCIILDIRRSLSESTDCPILSIGAEWRRGGPGAWQAAIGGAGSTTPLILPHLAPATWYEIRISAENHAGRSTTIVRAATTTLTGALISPPVYFPMEPPHTHDIDGTRDNIFNLISIIFATVAAISTLSVAYILIKKRSMICHCNNQSEYGGDRQRSQSQASDEKTICAEHQNMRNCQHDYSTSPIKGHVDKMRRESSEMYEISPYATFQVGGSTRPVAPSTLDHTLQFRTFGHIENDALPLQAQCKRHYMQKTHRHTSTKDDEKLGSTCEMQPLRMRNRPRQCSSSTYGIPIPQDIYQRESSTESNELSPPPDRARTPRHFADRPLHIHQPPNSHS